MYILKSSLEFMPHLSAQNCVFQPKVFCLTVMYTDGWMTNSLSRPGAIVHRPQTPEQPPLPLPARPPAPTQHTRAELGKTVWRNTLKEFLLFSYSDEIAVIIHRCTDLLCRFTKFLYAWRPVATWLGWVSVLGADWESVKSAGDQLSDPAAVFRAK